MCSWPLLVHPSGNSRYLFETSLVEHTSLKPLSYLQSVVAALKGEQVLLLF
jgi:hypothetical protein